MKLNLQRPLIFFDLETTGVNVTRDRIVEISYIKVMPDGTEISNTKRINPEIPIPASATAVHHITNEDVKDCPMFKDVAAELNEFFEGCDIAGFNSNKFDVPLLATEFSRVGISFDLANRKFVDVQTIYHRMEQRTLSAAYRFYCNANLEDAHSAMADTRATYEVLKAQLDRYPATAEFGNDVDKLAQFSTQNNNIDLSGRFSRNEEGVVVFNFGKYKGQSVLEIIGDKDPRYYDWMMQGDFPKDTKDVLTSLRNQLPKRGKRQ